MPDIKQSHFEILLSLISERLSRTQADLPCVSCLSQRTLQKEVLRIRDSLTDKSIPKYSAKNIILHLENSGIIKRVEVTLPGEKKPPTLFHIGFDGNSFTSPIELMTAIEPGGVISFFGALEIHELTTHSPGHYNICILNESSKNTQTKEEQNPITRKSSKQISRNPLGSLLFESDSIPFYRNKRKKHLVPGITERFYSSKTRYKVTTIEQTLLDTLQYPIQCGGPEIVFEVWDNLSEYLNEESLIELLSQIDNYALSRRLATMLDLIDYECSARLTDYLKKDLKRYMDKTNLVPLLAGMNYARANNKWKTLVP
jgi:predicted transcriptional regulator of viral defense system